MSCKDLDCFNPKENPSCKEGFSGLYGRIYMSKEEVEELIESGDFEMKGNSKGEVCFVRKEEIKWTEKN